MTAVVVLLSGGMDSSVLLGHVSNTMPGVTPIAVSVNYGQRHICEVDAAARVAAHYRATHHTIDLSVLRDVLTGSSLTDDDVAVPDGHYAEDTMRATVVPNRNAIMLAVAAGFAVAQGASRVMTAVHAGDHYIYPDCRPEFINAMSQATALGTAGFGDVTIEAPFVQWTKAHIAGYGVTLGVPLEMTWSCYKGGAIHCGSCGTCYERREAFTLAGVVDRTEYATEPNYTDPRPTP